MKNKSNKVKGCEAEKRVEKCINSGSFWHDKGDLKTDTHLIDVKSTDKKSFSITTKMLQKIYDEALDRNKLPALVVVIEREDCRWMLKVEINKEVK